MKNAKNPNLKQKKAMTKAGLNFENWLVIKSLPDELHLVHRETGKEKVIPI